jgi:hypothetical protein
MNPSKSQAASPPMPRRSVDERGRAIPMTEGEIRQRAEEAIRALDALDEMGSEEEQRETLDTLMRLLDEDRMSYRKRSGPCDRSSSTRGRSGS